jgi:hypothetical protein
VLAGLAASAVLSSVGSQTGVTTEPWNGMSPRLTTLPFLMTGRTTQSVEVFGGRIHAVVPAALPASPCLQSVEPWSQAQLCPPPVGAPVV